LVKITPIDIDQWLNPQVLAYWFMDDGSINGNTYYVNTQSYTINDQLKLQQPLINLEIKSSIKKDKISKDKVLYKL
jgi:hypothetical protein